MTNAPAPPKTPSHASGTGLVIAAILALLAVLVACLDGDFGVMFLALIWHLAPDGASGFSDLLLLLREIAAMALANHAGEVALGFLLCTALFSIRHDQNSHWSQLSPIILQMSVLL